MERGSTEFRKRMVDCLAGGDSTAFTHAEDAEQKRDPGVAAALIILDACLGHFTTVSRAMKFYDNPVREWVEVKDEILNTDSRETVNDKITEYDYRDAETVARAYAIANPTRDDPTKDWSWGGNNWVGDE